MNTSDLLSMLDLGGKDKPTPTPAVSRPGAKDAGGGATPARGPAPTHAVQLDAWDVERGVELCMAGHFKGMPGVAADTAADLHPAAYSIDPKLNDRCVEPRRLEFVRNLMDTPEYKSLRQSTTMNLVASELAAVQFAKQYSELSEKDEKRRHALRNAATQKQRDKVEAQGDRDMIKAVGKALQAATADVDELEEVAAGLGIGAGGGEGGQADAGRIAKLFKRVRGSVDLKRICELAGRYRRLAQAKQRQKQIHGYDDMVGVELDGDVGRLLPTELAALADPDLELDALRRIAERQAFCRQFQGVEDTGRGPIVVVVDESGSMAGEPLCQAKAFALAMAWIAKHQGRWCALVSFSDMEGDTPAHVTLPPARWDEVKLCEWLTHNYAGGTSATVPLDRVPAMWAGFGEAKGKADMIVITDGGIYVAEELARQFTAWKAAEKVRLITLAIGCNPGGLGPVSDEVHVVDGMTVEDDAVGRCLSL